MGEYQKGYNAGRRRAKLDHANAELRAIKEQFEREVFLAVLPELIRAPWQVNGEAWKNMQQFVNGARKFARLSVATFSFPLPPPEDEDA